MDMKDTIMPMLDK